MTTKRPTTSRCAPPKTQPTLVRGRADRATTAPARHRLPPGPAGSFVAIDFETATKSPDSACAVALVRVENDEIVRRETHFIRPPRREVVFTYLHGISWEDVATAPTFGDLWPKLTPMLDGAEFLAAHWATFDQGVLHACCAAARLRPPALRFECTVEWAKRVWGLRTAKLPDVCRHLGLRLDHHDAASDAEACARIMIAARKDAGRRRPTGG
ncbi:MAG: 3'-5' exonuclease [Deltaproteobacteria bacterium]|nr:3'-5' exonuclease [Deltaproteobacteria bacterium]